MERAEGQIVFFANNQEPRQLVLSGSTVIGRGERAERREGRILLDYPFLAEEQLRLVKEKDSWYCETLTDGGAIITIAGESIPKGERRKLHDFSSIHLNGQDGTMTILFRQDAPISAGWRVIELNGNAGDDSSTYSDGDPNITTGAVSGTGSSVNSNSEAGHTVQIMDATDVDKPKDEQDVIDLGLENGKWSIKELHSEQVFVNDRKVSGPCELKMDDSVELGNTTFLFEGSRLIYSIPESDTAVPLSICIDERTVLSGFNKKTLLKDINLEIKPGEMVLILGGSGAGKTTFVNAVTGYEKAKASIRRGDVDFYRDYNDIKYKIGFVPQSDLMRGEDTVAATLLNAAQMRLPAEIPEAEKRERVHQTLAMFGLSELENEPVSKLSGGQRKRLSICVEYIADPTIFILDEPDSGLDGVMARDLMERLKAIAREGRIVMVITHQPDRAADLFDKVIVLAKGGKEHIGQLAFFGTVSECRSFFEVETMEQVVRSINSVSEGGLGEADYFIEKYRKHRAYTDKEKAWKEIHTSEAEAGENADAGASDKAKEKFSLKNAFRRNKQEKAAALGTEYGHAGHIEQTGIYLGKLLRLFVLEKHWVVLVMAAVIAFLVSYVVGLNMFQSMEGAKLGGLAFGCVCIWNGFFNSIQMVCKERDIVKREHRAGLHITAYMAAQVIYQAAICALQVLIFQSIFAWKGLVYPESGVFFLNTRFEFGITLFLITFSADMLALMVSCLVRNTTTAMTIIPFLLMVQMLFSDVAFPLSGKVAKLADITVSKWGIRAMCAQARYNTLPSTSAWRQFTKIANQSEEGKLLVQYMKENNLVSEFQSKAAASLTNVLYASTPSNLLHCWGVLLGFSALYIAVGTIALEFIDRDKR